MNNIEVILNNLSKSKFRSSFHLRKYMIEYIDKVGIDEIKKHTEKFVEDRLSASYPKNDGKQTPMKGHPTFIAMHACACCCRGCLEKWHKIPKGRELNINEKKFIIDLLNIWLIKKYSSKS